MWSTVHVHVGTTNTGPSLMHTDSAFTDLYVQISSILAFLSRHAYVRFNNTRNLYDL